MTGSLSSCSGNKSGNSSTSPASSQNRLELGSGTDLILVNDCFELKFSPKSSIAENLNFSIEKVSAATSLSGDEIDIKNASYFFETEADCDDNLPEKRIDSFTLYANTLGLGGGQNTSKVLDTKVYFRAKLAGRLKFVVSDSSGKFKPAEFEIKVNDPPRAPIAQNLSIVTNKNVAATSTLSATDSNVNDSVTFAIGAQLPAKGVVTLNDPATGAFTYTPNANEFGTDSFTYTATDESNSASNIATVTVTINDTLTAPVSNTIAPAAFYEGTESGVITLSYSDADGDPATSCSISNLQHVRVTAPCACDGAGVCTLKVTGAADVSGLASFDYIVTAGGQNSNTSSAALTLIHVSDPPTISNIADTATDEDAAKTVNFTVGDVDSILVCSSASLSLSSSNTALVPNASVVWSGTYPNCTATLTPAADQYGTSTITITVSDGSLTAQDSFVLTVNRLSDDPITGNVYGFDTGDHASYEFSDGPGASSSILGSLLEFSSNLVRLKEADQSDDSTYGFGAGHGESFAGGAQYDSTNSYVRLGTTNAAPELDLSWAPAGSNIVALWHFNESAATAGASNDFAVAVGDHAGEASGTVTFGTTSGAINKAPKFDGSTGSVSLGASDFLSGLSNVTVSAWVRWDGTYDKLDDGTSASILQDNTRFSLVALPSTGRPQVCFDTNNGWYCANAAAVRLDDNALHHIAAVMDSGKALLSLYVDGRFLSSTTISASTVSTSSNTLYMGSTGSADYWNGLVDEVAFWNTALSSTAVWEIYQHQRAKYAGTLTSRVFDALSTGQSWTRMDWAPTLPFDKALPATSESNDSLTGYSSLYSGTLTDGLKGVWHFEETSLTAGALNDFANATGGGAGEASGTTHTLGTRGVFGNGILSDGASYLKFGTGSATVGITRGTISFWVKPDFDLTTSTRYAFWTWNRSPTLSMGLFHGEPGQFKAYVHNGAHMDEIGFGPTNSKLARAKWTHLVFTYDLSANTAELFVDGKTVSGVKTLSTSYGDLEANGYPTLGAATASGALGNTMPGAFDEYATWDRVLDASEIKQLYRRYANRIKYQVRSCADSTCSTDPSWLGPDGSNQSYFSELYNTASNSLSGEVSNSLPTISFANFGSLTVPANRYFQYRAIMESDDTNNLCNYGSGATACSPELKGVTAGPPHYSKDKPFIIGSTGVAFYNLSGFTEALGTTSGCDGGVKYQLSTDKSTWKWWDPSGGGGSGAWVSTSDSTAAEANTSAQLATAGVISSFGASVGRGSVYFKAFLTSDGAQACELDTVTISGGK